MANLQFQFGTRNVGRKFKLAADLRAQSYRRASKKTMEQLRDKVLNEGRANMRGAGNFGSRRWQQGFKGRLLQKNKEDWSVTFTHDVSYFMVFQTGKVIRGRPLLWIPLRGSRAASMKVRARDFPQPLFRVDRDGGKAPLLLSKRRGQQAEVQYFGKRSVRIPKKFRIIEIIRAATKRIQSIFAKNVRDEKRN